MGCPQLTYVSTILCNLLNFRCYLPVTFQFHRVNKFDCKNRVFGFYGLITMKQKKILEVFFILRAHERTHKCMHARTNARTHTHTHTHAHFHYIIINIKYFFFLFYLIFFPLHHNSTCKVAKFITHITLVWKSGDR